MAKGRISTKDCQLFSWKHNLERATALLHEAAYSNGTLWTVTDDAVKEATRGKRGLDDLIGEQSGGCIARQRLAIQEMLDRVTEIVGKVQKELVEAGAETPGSLVAA